MVAPDAGRLGAEHGRVGDGSGVRPFALTCLKRLSTHAWSAGVPERPRRCAAARPTKKFLLSCEVFGGR